LIELMPSGRRANSDPRHRLARLVARLEDRLAFVTLDDIVAGARRSLPSASSEVIPALVESAVAESLLLKDLRTFFDRRDQSFEDQWVYRLNPRHAIGRELLTEADT
jgi:hypothetical protein